MPTNPFHPREITPTDSKFGRMTGLSWSRQVELNDLRLGTAGEVHLAIKLTESSVPEYGSVTLDAEGRLLQASGWPTGVYLPSLFWGPDRKLLVLGNVEENEKEREVFFPANEASLPPSRPRLAASMVELLGVREGSLVRFLSDFMQKGAPKLVVDPLLPKGKRVAAKLPADPYPSAALLDGEGRLHLIARGVSKGKHMVFDLLGTPLGVNEFDLSRVVGFGGLRPLALSFEGSGAYVTGHEHGVGVMKVDAGGHTEYKESVKLPAPDAKVYMVLPARTEGSYSATHFTWGSDTTGSGAGWLVVRDGRTERSWVSEPGGYRDQRGTLHPVATGKTILRGLDVMADGTAVGVFTSDAASTSLWVARVSA